MAKLEIDLDECVEDLEMALEIIKNVIETKKKEKEAFDLRSKERKRKKTITELQLEIDEDIADENESIINSHIEIENLQNKKVELEKKIPQIPAIVKKKINRKKKTVEITETSKD